MCVSGKRKRRSQCDGDPLLGEATDRSEAPANACGRNSKDAGCRTGGSTRREVTWRPRGLHRRDSQL